MSNAFVQKLQGYASLTDEDVELLTAACVSQRDVPARYDLIREGDNPKSVFVMLEGWAYGYKMLPEGGRQIIAFMIPGDFCDMHVAELDHMDHSIATMTRSRVSMIPRDKMEHLVESRPALKRAFWKTQLVDEGILRSWMVSMGRRTSLQRVAHLLSELCVRTQNMDLATADRCELPISQIVLADALGLTPVHVNRVLGRLRALGVMERHARLLIITDIAELGVIAGFDPNYLQMRMNCAEDAIRLHA